MAAVISEAGIKEFESKMAEITKLLQYWENGIPVDIIRKDCSSSDEETREDGDTSDNDHESGVNECHEHFDINHVDVDVSRVATEIESEVDKSSVDEIAICSSEVHYCSDWSGSLAKGKEDFIDNDEYNESVELVMQEEDIAKDDTLESTLFLIKLPMKMQKRSSKRISKNCYWLTKEKT